MAISATPIKRLPATGDFSDIFQAFQEDGGVIVKGFLSASEVARFNSEIQPALDRHYAGTKSSNGEISKMLGNKTKRFCNLATESETFRHNILEKDILHQMCDAVFNQAYGVGYWLNGTQVIELEPGAPAQPLHRDQESFGFWNSMGPSSPEALLNFFCAMTPFTEANGATRFVPGSHRWAKFSGARDPDFEGFEGVETLPLEMDPGDCFIMSSKLLHGGGHNSTLTERRRGLAISVIRHDLAPYQAYALTVPLDIVKSLTYRAQGLYGFRSAHWTGYSTAYTIWAAEEEDVGARLGLTMGDMKIEAKSTSLT
ncbi:hypothetical protein CNMCM5623_004585 [Aspergillus felis]|uniref:Phytanoyl-CoA dioxygenase family protein n=1 Tax=Aspergillus felis TaxID=1287682 RepID=A0A8H6UZE3_9EURO|nr:hypothetical protein CNMCM5623_004585 [Aspergillus felis]KAF7177669.1 hypothetical protein CNMCM7691_006030 [Aspergillus felis]